MKRVLFDENLPEIASAKAARVRDSYRSGGGWGSFRNGKLLRRAEGLFDVLLTADRRMEYQQKLTSFQMGVVVIDTHSLQLDILERAVNDIARRSIASSPVKSSM